MSCAESSSSAAVCADGKDDRNEVARLLAQEAKERGAQTPQQMEQEETLERRHQHQEAKLVSEASPAWICGALAVCGGA
jgi:hypothetical protein